MAFGNLLLYWNDHHRWWGLVNGYSGFFPMSFLGLKEAMQSFPDEPSLRQLAERDITYCVVRRDVVAPAAVAKCSKLDNRLVHVFADERAQVDIYRLMGVSFSP